MATEAKAAASAKKRTALILAQFDTAADVVHAAEKVRDTVEDMRGKVDEMVASMKSRGMGSSGNGPASASLAEIDSNEAPAAGV